MTRAINKVFFVTVAILASLQAMGQVDVLINNAGISIRHDFLDITPEEWGRVLDVNRFTWNTACKSI